MYCIVCVLCVLCCVVLCVCVCVCSACTVSICGVVAWVQYYHVIEGLNFLPALQHTTYLYV